MRFCILILVLLFPRVVTAAPMLAPTMAEACNVNSVVEAEYVSYRKRSWLKPVTYFEGPIATYRVVRHVHGATTTEMVNVLFSFDDGSACIEPENWKFSEGLMPKEGSKWLLFLQASEVEGASGYVTYRGDFGRVSVGVKAQDFLSQCEKIWNEKK